MTTQAAPVLPFTIASRVSRRQSFQLSNIPLQSSTVTTPAGAPVQIPAVGWAKNIRLEVTATITGGTPSFTADAPFNLIDHVTFRNSAGQNLVAPLSGIEWYYANKYFANGQGLTSGVGRLSDAKVGRQYAATAASTIHFFLDIPFEFDPQMALGALPVLASNRAYQLEVALSSITTVFGVTTPPTAVSVTIDASINFWDLPNGSDATEPFGVNTLSIISKENPALSSGDQLTKITNTGNVIRNILLIARTSAGVRDDADFPNTSELYLDNNPLLRYKKTEWEDDMIRQYGLEAASKDAANGLDSGVYVIPFHLYGGGLAGDPSNVRSQLLATLDATQLQFKGYQWGAGIAGGQLTIITQSISSPNSAFIYSK
jgi:hypothetical protein